jgi:hypothetical protein
MVKHSIPEHLISEWQVINLESSHELGNLPFIKQNSSRKKKNNNEI